MIVRCISDSCELKQNLINFTSQKVQLMISKHPQWFLWHLTFSHELIGWLFYSFEFVWIHCIIISWKWMKKCASTKFIYFFTINKTCFPESSNPPPTFTFPHVRSWGFICLYNLYYYLTTIQMNGRMDFIQNLSCWKKIYMYKLEIRFYGRLFTNCFTMPVKQFNKDFCFNCKGSATYFSLYIAFKVPTKLTSKFLSGKLSLHTNFLIQQFFNNFT